MGMQVLRPCQGRRQPSCLLASPSAQQLSIQAASGEASVTAARSRAQETPEFQDRYAETVIFRIFYHLDRSGLGRLTLRDLKRCGPRWRPPGAPARAAPARPIQRAVAGMPGVQGVGRQRVVTAVFETRSLVQYTQRAPLFAPDHACPAPGTDEEHVTLAVGGLQKSVQIASSP